MYNGKQIRIYYHCFLTEDQTWIFILLDQMELIISSGLMDVVDEIRIFVGGTEDQIIKFKKSISCYPYTKIKIVYWLPRRSKDENSEARIPNPEEMPRPERRVFWMEFVVGVALLPA